MIERKTINPKYREAVTELLFQLADDDFILSYRGSEWLGLAPHIEEDVAFSSISQDTMGHAAMFYQMLEELGVGSADALAHERSAKDRKNAVLVEFKNGTGHYMKLPKYDWAFAVVRNYFYVTAKYTKMKSLTNSSYAGLSNVSEKILMELHYHVLHWKTWFYQLLTSNEEAKKRMNVAIERVYQDLGGLFDLGKSSKEIVGFGLIEDEKILIENWLKIVTPVLTSVSVLPPTKFVKTNGDGRNGEHTAELIEAIEILSEVYNEDPFATW